VIAGNSASPSPVESINDPQTTIADIFSDDVDEKVQQPKEVKKEEHVMEPIAQLPTAVPNTVKSLVCYSSITMY
jgi:hypothetical protein